MAKNRLQRGDRVPSPVWEDPGRERAFSPSIPALRTHRRSGSALYVGRPRKTRPVPLSVRSNMLKVPGLLGTGILGRERKCMEKKNVYFGVTEKLEGSSGYL